MNPPDLGRLARALHLDAVRLTAGAWRVAGGAIAHEVNAEGTRCDCTDYGVHGGACKHMLAVRLHSGDTETLAALRALVPLPRRASLRRPRLP